MDAPSIPPIDMPRLRPPIPQTDGKAVDIPDPVISPDIPTSFPHRPAPDSVGSIDSSESFPPSTTTETSTSDIQSASPEPSILPITIVTTSPSAIRTTDTFISSAPFPSDSDTVPLSTRTVSGSSRFIPPTLGPTFGPSILTTSIDDLIPSSSRLTYPTDNGNNGSNSNNIPPSDGSVSGGNPSTAAEQRRFSTGAIVGIVISLTLFCFVGFVFWRRRQRQALRTEHANRWWFSRTRRRPESDTYNVAERPATVYSSSFGSSFERTRSNSSLSSDEFDGSSHPPMVEVVLSGPHSLATTDSQYFVRPDSQSTYNESTPPPPPSVRLPSNPPSETSTVLPQHPSSPKNNSSYSITSSGRSLSLIPGPGSPKSRVFIPPIPPLPKSPPPIPITMSDPFLDRNPFDDPVHH